LANIGNHMKSIVRDISNGAIAASIDASEGHRQAATFEPMSDLKHLGLHSGEIAIGSGSAIRENISVEHDALQLQDTIASPLFEVGKRIGDTAHRAIGVDATLSAKGIDKNIPKGIRSGVGLSVEDKGHDTSRRMEGSRSDLVKDLKLKLTSHMNRLHVDLTAITLIKCRASAGGVQTEHGRRIGRHVANQTLGEFSGLKLSGRNLHLGRKGLIEAFQLDTDETTCAAVRGTPSPASRGAARPHRATTHSKGTLAIGGRRSAKAATFISGHKCVKVCETAPRKEKI